MFLKVWAKLVVTWVSHRIKGGSVGLKISDNTEISRECKNAYLSQLCKVPKLYSVPFKILNFIPKIKNVGIPLSRNLS